MTESSQESARNPNEIPPLPELPPIQTPSANIDPRIYETWTEIYSAWQKTLIDCFQDNRKMFKTILKGFMKPFWLSVGMNVVVFVVGIISFSAAMVLSLLIGQYLLGVLFGGIDATTFLAFFLSNPIRNLETDMGFVTWLGLTYNTYWTRTYYAQNPNTFQKDMQDITDDAIKALQQLLATHKEVSASEFLRHKALRPVQTTKKEQETKP